jgi:diketogulonate reductase-like aldo/keto reductase
LKLGAGAAAALTLGRPLVGFAQQSNAILRSIPSSGEQLPVIGVGTNNYSVTGADDVASRREVLQNLPQLGARVVDTARGYGQSEVVIGNIVKELGNRDELFIATKTPMGGDFSDPAAVLQVSFNQLQVETIDLMMVHNLAGTDQLMPTILSAKESGRIRYTGISTSSDRQYDDLMAAMRRYPLDFIQIDYSIGNRSAAERVLPLAQERGIAVLINTPFGGRRNAASLFGLVADRPLPDFAADIDATSWAQVFLKFIIGHQAVTTAIPGMTQLRHLQDNAQAGFGRLPNAELRREIERYWDTIDV